MQAVYIHIPFCDHICSYCDFPKFLASTNYQREYLDALKKEINSLYQNEEIKTIYIGGGTPSSLSYDDLRYLFDIVKIFKTSKDLEFTIEANIESIDLAKLELFKEHGVNRISIGIESFNDKYLKYLNRHYQEKDIYPTIELVKKYFSNINVDLMYAFFNQSIEELKEDILKFKKLDVEHISTYSLIIEPNTVLYNQKTKEIDEDIDYLMYQEIIKELSDYHHYEVSNFAKHGYESKHNLTYWHNLNYYGFGIGASGYIGNKRYTNTRSINNYIAGKYVSDEHILTKEEEIGNYFMLNLRLLDGIDINDFCHKYQMDIKDYKNVTKLISDNKLIMNGNKLFINPKYIYISNEILIDLI